MKKVLIIAHIIQHIKLFHIPYIEWFKANGYEVHVLTNASGEELPCCDKLYDIGIERSPFSIKNLRIIGKVKKIIDSENYDLIHSHTPMGGVIGRLAAIKARKKGTKIFYTAHGFHFYKGAPKINWIIYFTVEKILSYLTDCILTINEEDYEKASKSFKHKKTQIKKINGIGVNLQKFSSAIPAEKQELKRKNGYDNNFLLIYAAEFIERKNYRFLIDNVRALSEICPNIKLVFCGAGVLYGKMLEYADKKGVSNLIDFLGFRNDMPDMYKMSDILVSSSFQEGLATNVIEGLACGLPVVATNIRGHKDIIVNGRNGYLFDIGATDAFIADVKELIEKKEMYLEFSKKAIETSKKFNLENCLRQHIEIYKEYGI